MTMSTTPRSTVVGVFEDPEAARRAISDLKEGGFQGDAISVLTPDRGDTRAMAEETGTHAGGGAATGAVAGGLLGGLGGWLVGIGALAIPGVGPFIAAGAFATALGGAAVGAGVGAIAGALMGMGVPEEHAKYYEGEVREGRTLVTVRADNRFDDAQRILRDAGAYDIESRDGTQHTMPLREADGRSGTQQTMPLREEELHARTDQVQTGQVSKRPVVYEEVNVGTREVTDTRQVSGTVRREEARVERDGEVEVDKNERL
jgi:Domain of unknown function (DUF2382)/Heat induced stress protein YflT